MAQERRVAKNLELQNQPGDSAEYLALQDTGNIADRWRLQEDSEQASDWQPVEYSRPPKARPGWILPSIVGVVLVAVVGYVAWIGFNQFGSGETAQDPQVTAPADGSAGDETVAQTDGTAESPADDTQSGEQTEAQQTATSEAAAPLATATTPPTPVPSPTVVLVEQQIATITNQYGVNAREEPTLDSEVIRILEQGETAVIIDEQEDDTIDGNWLQVRISEGTLAWISSGFVEISTQMVPADEGVAIQPTAEAPDTSDTVTDTVTDTVPAETPDDVVETPTDTPADLPVSVTISSTFGLNARTAPSSDAEIVATLEDQSTYTANQRSEDGQWVEVTLDDGTAAWVFTEFVATTGDLSTLPIAGEAEEEAASDAPVASTETLTETATTTETAPSEVGVTAVVSSTFGANARATADTTANVLRVVPTGNEVTVVGRTEDSEWLQVELDDGRVGWIFTSAVLITPEEVETLPVVEPEPVGDTPDLLAPAPDGATATVVSLIGTNARSTPDTSEPTIQAVPSGSELPVLGRSADNQWVQVVLDDGTEAWVFTNNVELNVDLESLPVTE